jgi:hypothetical protein
MFSRALSSLVLLLLAVPAQPPVPTFPAPAEVLAAFHLRAACVQNLTLPASAGPAFTVRIDLGGATHILELRPHDVRSADFRLLVDDGTGVRQLATPASVTYRGEVVGLAGSDVAGTLIDGQLSATIWLHDGTLWAVQPLRTELPALPRQSHVVYRARDVVHPDARCGVGLAARGVAIGQGGGGAPAALKIAEIAVDADRAYYARYGSNVTTVQNQVTSVINSMSVIYRRDVEIDYSITAILVRTTNIYSWTGDLCNLLSQFGNYWASNHGAVRRDLAHLFTGEGSFSGVIGCAYLGVVCTNSAYGSSKAFSANLTTNVGLVAHEVGHNWNAPHCDSTPPCHIMCSGLGGCAGNISSFEPTTASRIIAFKNTRTCLSDPAPPILSTLTPNSASAYAPAQVTATGTRLDGTAALTVGGRSTPFTVVNATTLRFTPPALLPIGPQAVIASNSAGASPPVNLTITGNHPSVLVMNAFIARGIPSPVSIHSDANWLGVLLFSTSNVPSSVPGLISLGIGNAFTDLYTFVTAPCGSNGAASLNVTLPTTAPPGLVLHWQALTLDPANPTLPLETSNVRQTQVL